jgi:hypothetical protein
MSNAIRATIAVCEALGIDIKNAVAVDIALRPDSLPRVRITRVLMDNPSGKTRQQFELRAIGPAKPTPLNLDKMCADAVKRVLQTIERSAAKHLSQMRERNRLDPSNRALYEQICVLKGGAA